MFLLIFSMAFQVPCTNSNISFCHFPVAEVVGDVFSSTAHTEDIDVICLAEVEACDCFFKHSGIGKHHYFSQADIIEIQMPARLIVVIGYA